MNQEQLQKKIGERVITLRTEKGWKQADLAKACNKSPQAIEKIENGKVNSSIFSLFTVASALKVSLSELMDF